MNLQLHKRTKGQKDKRQKFDEVELPADHVIYRDLNVIPVGAARGPEDGGVGSNSNSSSSSSSSSVIDDFIAFATQDAEAERAMEAAGWYKEF